MGPLVCSGARKIKDAPIQNVVNAVEVSLWPKDRITSPSSCSYKRALVRLYIDVVLSGSHSYNSANVAIEEFLYMEIEVIASFGHRSG